MSKAISLFALLFAIQFNSFSQNSINDYKYVIVPLQYKFMKEKDKYQLNSLTKFLFNKYGYTAYMEDEDLPTDLANNRCLALMADVEDDSSLLKTKVRIDLKNCNGKTVMSSEMGESREKQYDKSYNLALRSAFETFQNFDYHYQPDEAVASRSTEDVATVDNVKQQEEIEKLKEEIKSLKEEQQSTVSTVETTVENSKDAMADMNAKDSNEPISTLYAQPIDNGYQLIDSTPKVIMILINTGVKEVFSVKDSDAIVYKKDGAWMYSEDGNILKGKPFDIKF